MRKLVALGVALTLLAAACGGGDDDDTTDPAPGSDGTAEPTEDAASPSTPTPRGPGLVIGRVLPETGSLAFLSAPLIEGVNLAVEDIQAAGGNVTMLSADSGTDPTVAPAAVNRLLAEGAQVIVGAAASGVTNSFIQTLYDAQVAQCSPSVTAPDFTARANTEFFFRTVTPDALVAPIIADEVSADGATNVAIVARADDYGAALGSLLQSSFNELGVQATIVQYDPASPSFDATVQDALAIGPDAIVFVTFAEGAQIVRLTLEQGVPPAAMYGGDGLFSPTLPGLIDPSNPNVVDGMKVFGSTGDDAFNDRLGELTGGNLIYGGQAYDCVVVMVLAAEAAGSTSGSDILAAVPQVTGEGGTVCTSYAECSDLLAAGETIDYEGVAGPLHLDAAGDPTFGRYGIARFEDGQLDSLSSQDVEL